MDATGPVLGTAGLAMVFVLAWAAGTAAAPAARPPVPTVEPSPAAPGQPVLAGAEPLGEGLGATAAGWTLLPRVDRLEPGVPGEYAFTLVGPGDRPAAVRLAVVRRDGAGFGRAPVVAGPDGVWRSPLTLPAAGTYRVYVAFTPPGGAPLVLGADVSVPGEFRPVPGEPVRVARTGPYQVRLDGEPVAAVASPVFATVSVAGRPVTDLEPVEGGFGTLVAVRGSDLAWADVPADTVTDRPADRAGPGIAFTATLPVPGPHALFLQFRHAGAVHTVGFRVDVA